MRVSSLFTVAVASSLLAFAAEAGPKGNHGNSGHGHAKHDAGHSASHSDAANCPPGLAKKDPPCIPPGQVRNAVIPQPDTPDDTVVVYHTGDTLPDDYVILVNPQIYDPNIDAVYVAYGPFLYLIDRLTGEVLTRLGYVSDWTWAWDGTDATNCPPGLAKKDPPCIPPGQVGKIATAATVLDDPYGIGEILPQGYSVALDPKLYAPNANAEFVRQGDQIYRADGLTGQVLDEVGQIGRVIPDPQQ